MLDLPADANVSRLVTGLYVRGAPIAALCLGPALLLSAPERHDGQWLFEGYRLTAFTNEEEYQNDIGRLGLPWYLASALQNAGGVLDDAPAPWESHVVVVIATSSPARTPTPPKPRSVPCSRHWRWADPLLPC